MANPNTEVERFRTQVTQFVDNLRDIDALLAIVEDHGATDAERQAFFEGQFGVDKNFPDLTWATFAQGVIALRAIQTARNTNKIALAKLLI